MKRAFVALILGLLSLSLVGCGEEERITFYEGPLTGWNDVAVPEGSVLESSSPKESAVQNHRFTVEGTDQGEVFAFLEEAMEVNGWELNASSGDVLQFIKKGDLVTYNSNGVDEDGLFQFVLIIEPDGVYGD